VSRGGRLQKTRGLSLRFLIFYIFGDRPQGFWILGMLAQEMSLGGRKER
jgi:hypothetical protein